jgi:hypothetical protein
MRWAARKARLEELINTKLQSGNLKERQGGKIILKCIIKKQRGMVRIGFMWLRVDFFVCLMKTVRSFRFH